MKILSAQTVETLWQGKASIRAIEIYDDKVWFAGSGSQFGFVNLKLPSDSKIISLNDQNQEFRTLAQDANYFYTINVGSPANFYQIDKKSLEFKIINTDYSKNAFYDALHYSGGMFYTFSDPDDDLNLKFLEFNVFKDRFLSKKFVAPTMASGEAAFAASNSNIASSKNYLWLVTGGKVSRIFRLNKIVGKFEVFPTPMVQGKSSEGAYSIDFFKDKFGIIAGGDYTKQADNQNNIATSKDGGKTWHVQASGANEGYTTCVKIRPGSKGREIIAVGDQHISFSKDFGKTWTKISEEKNLYTGVWSDRNTVILAGKDKIVRLKF